MTDKKQMTGPDLFAEFSLKGFKMHLKWFGRQRNQNMRDNSWSESSQATDFCEVVCYKKAFFFKRGTSEGRDLSYFQINPVICLFRFHFSALGQNSDTEVPSCFFPPSGVSMEL